MTALARCQGPRVSREGRLACFFWLVICLFATERGAQTPGGHGKEEREGARGGSDQAAMGRPRGDGQPCQLGRPLLRHRTGGAKPLAAGPMLGP